MGTGSHTIYLNPDVDLEDTENLLLDTTNKDCVATISPVLKEDGTVVFKQHLHAHTVKEDHFAAPRIFMGLDLWVGTPEDVERERFRIAMEELEDKELQEYARSEYDILGEIICVKEKLKELKRKEVTQTNSLPKRQRQKA